MMHRIAPFSMTLRDLQVIQLLQNISNAIFRTVVHQLTSSYQWLT